MLDVVLNESDLIKNFKGNYKIPEGIKITDIIYLLAKNYYILGKEKDDIYECIMKDIEKTYKEDFIYTKWNNTVRNILNRFYKTKGIYNIEVRMNNIKEIKVTENELDKISQLDNLVLEKIAFILLVYAKISKIQMQQSSDEYWVNKSCSTICKEAKVGLKGNKQKKIMNELYKKDYISMSNMNTKINIKVNYVDDSSTNNENDLVITDFDGVVYQYLIWKGEKWKRCKKCNRWIKIKGVKDNSKKYCNVCSKEEKIRKTIENRKKLKSKESL